MKGDIKMNIYKYIHFVMATFYIGIVCLSAAFSLGLGVDICSNGTETGRTVILRRYRNSNRENCRCIFQLTGNTGTVVSFSTKDELYGCQYKLVFDFLQNRPTEEYSCRRYNLPNKYFNPGYNYTVVLEKHDNNNSGFYFSLEMATTSSNDGYLTIACSTTGNPILPTLVPTLASTTTEQIKTTMDTNGNRQTPNDDMAEKNDSLTVIIGCSVSGVVLISSVIITLVVCFQKQRKQQLTDCINDSSRSETMPDNSIQNDYNQTGTIPPNLYSNPDSVDNYVNDFHRYEHLPKQREPVPDTGIETENDLSQDNRIELNHNSNKVNKNNVYCSPDSVDNYVHDFHRYEHLPKQQERFPDTGIEHGVGLKEIKTSSNQESEIELNNNKNNVKVDKDYENLPKE